MPSFTTHYIHSNEVFNNLENNIQEKIKKEKLIYTTFAQSHDYFFYSPSKKIKDLGHYFHHHNTQEYLLNIIKYIKDNNLINSPKAIGYLYGSITHYVLDTTCHPYIFYKTGVYRNNKETKKYKGQHTKMEKDIDSLYYKIFFHNEYKKSNLNKDIIKKPVFNQDLINTINYAYFNTYKLENASTIIQKNIKHIKLINSLLVNDRTGLKLSIYKIIDKITNNTLSSYSTRHKPSEHFLNKENKKWNNPCNKNEIHSESFQELFDLSIKKSVNIINTIEKYFKNKTDLDTIKEIIPDLDYSSGLEIKDNKKLQFFEY